MNPWIVIAIYFGLVLAAVCITSLFEGPEELEDA